MLYSWKEKKVQVSALFQLLYSFLCWHAHHTERRQTSLEIVSSLVPGGISPSPTATAEHQTLLKWYDITVPLQWWHDVEWQHSIFTCLQLLLFLLFLLPFSLILLLSTERKCESNSIKLVISQWLRNEINWSCQLCSTAFNGFVVIICCGSLM